MRPSSPLLLFPVVLLLGACASRSLTKSTAPLAEAWLACYLNEQKIGYAMQRYQHLGDGYRFENLTHMTLGMMGRTQRLRVWSRADTDSQLTLKRFEFELTSQDGSYRGTGSVQNRRLHLTGGPTRTMREIVLPDNVYPVEALGMLVLNARMEPGSTREFQLFDATVMDILPTRVTMLGPAQVQLGDGTTNGFKLRVVRSNFEVMTWIDSTGLTMREESQLGMWSVRTLPESAVAGQPSLATLDILMMFRVPVDTVVPEPQAIRRVVLEVEGLDTTAFQLTGPTQNIISRRPLRVEVRSELPTQQVTLPLAGMDQFLEPTLSVQSTDPQIRKVARQVAGNEVDAAAVARLLSNWVFRSLEKRATASFPNARDVLNNMSGDCNEHAVLYAAMARSLGLPCRVVVGLAYVDRAFYYHAWNEVFIGTWVPVDATFGEFPANALRLQLATGELSQQAEILGAVRRIRLRISEFE